MKQKLHDFASPFCWIAVCYVAVVMVLRLVDTIMVLSAGNAGFGIFCWSVLHNLVSCGVVLTGILALYAVLFFASRRCALAVTSVVVGIMALTEIGLDFFAAKSGVLLGDEILLRPFGEMVNTVKASVGNMLWLYLFVGLAFIAFVPMFVKRISRCQMPLFVTPVVALFLLLSILIVGKLPRIERKSDNPSVQNYITNKSLYLLRNCALYGFNHKASVDLTVGIATDTTLLRDFVAEFPERRIEDVTYPLERKLVDAENTLSPFFAADSIAPNVVFVVVESLGREWSGPNGSSVSYTPFLDSLAAHSLYWRNCLATTKRSFGAVPALTGSVPHGPRGFQFGNMPNHNSLISVLKNAGYQTNAFYASDFAFDCVMEYLMAQHIDYMSTDFRDECFSRDGSGWGTYWGYHDEFLFSRSMDVIDAQARRPMFNLYVTISAHDNLSENTPHFDEIMASVDSMIGMLPKASQAAQRSNSRRIASVVYSDYALSKLFELYRQRSDYQNTIFVITGDHSAEIDSKNRLGFYHVPLIIYSPLLSHTADFPAVVTHLDVVPSVLALLHNNYGVSVPETESWAGRGLDTCRHFRSNCRFMPMDYAHDIGEILYDKYFYFKEKDAVYEIDSSLNFTMCNDEQVRAKIIGKLDMFKQVNNYIYLNDRLIHSPIYDRGNYANLSVDSVAPIECHAQPEPPSRIEPQKFPLIMDKPIFLPRSVSRLRVVFSADISIEGNLYKDKQMKLFFECSGRNKQVFGEHITSFLVEEKIDAGKWYKLLISKEFDVDNVPSADISVYIKTATDDWHYTNDNVLKLKNIKISFDGK